MSLEIRPARPADLDGIWRLLGEFSDYLSLRHEVTGTPARLGAHVFGGADPRLDCLVAEEGGRLVGYALYYPGFASFWTEPVMWLEDLFVTESHRARGLGTRMLSAVARAALDRGYGGLAWAVLETNTPAIAYYERLGADRKQGERFYRVLGDGLRRLAESGRADSPGGDGS